MKECLSILEHSRENPTTTINASSELYGACRHKPRYHRYPKNYTTISTDDERNSEIVKSQDIDNSPPMPDLIPLCTNIDPVMNVIYSNTEDKR